MAEFEPPPEYIGTDESGKGDFFGPLVIAGVYLAPGLTQKLEALNVLESKRITDNRAVSLASEIMTIAPAAIVLIGPEKYNQLYERMRNLNRLLGWGHARAIENILQTNPCGTAVSDQFGDERFIGQALLKAGRTIRLVQAPRAERFLAVAAASVVARAAFLDYLKRLSSQHGIPFPKGAGPQVDEAGRKFVAKRGADQLHLVAKLHFKNSGRIVST